MTIFQSSAGLLLGALLLQVVLQELDDDLLYLLDRVGLGEILLQRIMAQRDGVPKGFLFFHHNVIQLILGDTACFAQLSNTLRLGK